MIHYLVPAVQDHGMREYLGFWGRDIADRVRILHYEHLPGRSRFEPGTYVLSGLDQLGPAMRRLVGEIHRKLAPTSGFRFLNEPDVTLGRFDLLTELHRRGLNGFQALRADAGLDSLRYPVFLRADRTHDGAVSPLLGTKREVEAAIGRALLQGRRLKDLLVVEFSDTASPDGWYRKYNAFFVGDRVIPRGLTVGRDWMLKENRASRSQAIASEELDYVSGNPHRERLAEIGALAQVGYGRIDYSVRDGRVETWEINLNPVIGRGDHPSRKSKDPVVRRIRMRSKECFYTAFRDALEAVEERDVQAAVSPALDEAIQQAARSDSGAPRPPTGGLARFLEPGRPALEALAGGVLPWIGRMARSRSHRLSGH